MNTKIFPNLKKYLPIDIEKCRNYWDDKMNGFMMSSLKSKDWKACEDILNIINDDSIPVTSRTYILTVKLPFIIANFIVEGKALVNKYK